MEDWMTARQASILESVCVCCTVRRLSVPSQISVSQAGTQRTHWLFKHTRAFSLLHRPLLCALTPPFKSSHICTFPTTHTTFTATLTTTPTSPIHLRRVLLGFHLKVFLYIQNTSMEQIYNQKYRPPLVDCLHLCLPVCQLTVIHRFEANSNVPKAKTEVS